MAESRHNIRGLTDQPLSRRRLLTGAGASLSIVALGATIMPTAAAEAVCELPLDPAARFEAARAEFMAAAQALYPHIDHWTDNVTENGVLMFGSSPAKPVEYSGYGVYELHRGRTCPIVALAASESGAGYHWQMYWRDFDGKDRFTGRVRFIKTADLIIKRKIRALA